MLGLRLMYTRLRLILVVFAFVCMPIQLKAQSSPSELARLSIMELTNIDLSGQSDATNEEVSPWYFGYHYRHVEYEGYKNGPNDIPISQVLFSGVAGTRTNLNFPVVPTKIVQQAHVFNIGYKINKTSAINLIVPYVIQSTNHVSIVPGFDEFNISTEGIGDIVFSYTGQVWESNKHSISLSIGASFPSGSIDEQGDTPRGPGDQQLPYTMQLGSGTFDLPLAISYMYTNDKWLMAVVAEGKQRFGKNSREYRMGNQYSLGLFGNVGLLKWLDSYAKFDYRYTDIIHGADQEILVPGPFPNPAPITNPKFYGGKSLRLKLGIVLSPESGKFKNHKLDLSYTKPLYQDLNGIQVQEDHQIHLDWLWDF